MKLKFTLLYLSFFLASIFGYAQKKRVACIGDSITEGPGLPSGQTYPALLQSLLGDTDYEVRNFGLSGTTMLKKGDYPYWIEPKYAEAKNWQPDIVIIKFGTNDAKTHNWGPNSVEFEDDYTAMINEFKNSGANPKIYVVLPIVAFQGNGMITDITLTNEVIPKINNVALLNSVDVIDMHTPFNGKSNFTYDLIHPNPKGNKLIAYTIASKICTSCTLPDDALSLVNFFDYTDLTVNAVSSVGGSVSNLIDNNSATGVVQNYAQNMTYSFELSSSIKLTGYAITSGSDIAKNPKSWKLQASLDGNSWQDLSTQTNINLLPLETIVTDIPYAISNALASYKHYRLLITETNGGTQLEIRELQLFGFPIGYANDITSNGGIMSSLENSFSATESVDKLVDKNVDTKFCGPFNNSFGWVQYDSPTPQKVYKYSITSCASEREYVRDPTSWKLYGSNNGTDWDLMDTRINQTFVTRNQTLQYIINNQNDFSKFRLVVDGIVAGNVVQFSEWHLTSEGNGLVIPEELSIQGTAVNEASSIKMKQTINGFELYTSLKTGNYNFDGDNTIASSPITISETSAPYRIRVDYSGTTPVVEVRKITSISLWAPWSLHTGATLNYVGNSTFKATQLTQYDTNWGDNRYRIKLFLDGGIEETYQPSENVENPDASTPLTYYDLYAGPNGQWPGGAKEYKILSKYRNTGLLFDAEVNFKTDANYTHRITDYVSSLPISNSIVIAGSAVEAGTVTLKKKENGVFEFVGGLTAGNFSVSGEKDGSTYFYTLSGGQVTEGNTDVTINGASKPYYLKVDLVNGTFVLQEITSTYLFMSVSGTNGSDRLLLNYIGNGKFEGTKATLSWPTPDWSPSGDSRYKFKMDLANNTSVYWGSVNFDNQPPANEVITDPYYNLLSVNSDDYQYSYKFRENTKNQQVTVGLFFETNGNFYHKYLVGATLPLDLIAFNATPVNGKVKLVWKTENEVNFKEFEVERSADGLSFITIGNQASHKLAGPQTYSFTDNGSTSSSTLYYRLKIIDKDGTFKYSEVEVVKLPSLSKEQFKVLSSGSYLQIEHPITKSNAEVKIFSVSGSLLTKVNAQRGNNLTKVDITKLLEGVYIVLLKDGNQRYTSKFIK